MIVPAPASMEEAQQKVSAYLGLIKNNMKQVVQFHPTFESCERKWCEQCLLVSCPVRVKPYQRAREMTLDSLVEDNIHSPH